MAKENALAHVRPSLLNNFRINVLGHNCSYVDFDGNVGTLKYPPTKQYSPRFAQKIQELHITNVPVIDDKSTPIDDLRHFKYLRRLTLGSGVTGISRNSIPSSVEELTLSKDVTSIPEGYLGNGSLHIVSGPGYKIDIGTTATNDHFYLDKFQRLIIEKKQSLGIGLESHINQRGQSMFDFSTMVKLNSAESIIRRSNEFPNTKSLYFYAESMQANPNASIKIVLDSYPMPEKRKEGLKDDHLIALYVVDEKNLDVEKLNATYPNLRRVFVAESVKKVTNLEPSLEQSPYSYEQKLASGRKQQIILLSDKTTPIKKTAPASEAKVVESPELVQDESEVEK